MPFPWGQIASQGVAETPRPRSCNPLHLFATGPLQRWLFNKLLAKTTLFKTQMRGQRGSSPLPPTPPTHTPGWADTQRLHTEPFVAVDFQMGGFKAAGLAARATFN